MTYLIVILLSLYALVCLVMYRYQEKFLFFPMTLADDYPFAQFRDFEEVFMEVDTKVRLHALHFSVDQPKGTILYFHGNARALNDWGYAAQDLMALGYNVLMPDYRSYGKSTGTISEAALKADGQRWYDYLLQSLPETDLLLYGRSLGTGVASYVAHRNKPQLLILETPYTSLVAMAQTLVKFLPTTLLSRYRFHTDRVINEISCPIHLIHGTQDELIPYQQAVDLSRGQATLHTIDGGGHNNLAQFPEFYQILKSIL